VSVRGVAEAVAEVVEKGAEAVLFMANRLPASRPGVVSPRAAFRLRLRAQVHRSSMNRADDSTCVASMHRLPHPRLTEYSRIHPQADDGTFLES
jgi:hypothetical protein